MKSIKTIYPLLKKLYPLLPKHNGLHRSDKNIRLCPQSLFCASAFKTNVMFMPKIIHRHYPNPPSQWNGLFQINTNVK